MILLYTLARPSVADQPTNQPTNKPEHCTTTKNGKRPKRTQTREKKSGKKRQPNPHALLYYCYSQYPSHPLSRRRRQTIPLHSRRVAAASTTTSVLINPSRHTRARHSRPTLDTSQQHKHAPLPWEPRLLFFFYLRYVFA